RMIYNPIFAEDVYGLRSLFVRLARFRNLVYGLPPDFAVFGTDDGLWTAARLNQYPRGGGVMVAHRDRDGAPGAAVPSHWLIYQVFLLMSKRGEDFQTGGAFLEYRGETVSYEDECDVGDVMVYNGQVLHGVADVDPLEPLDLKTFSGRVAAFVSLFR